MAEKLASLRKKGGKGMDWCDTDECIVIDTAKNVNSFTNGSTVSFGSNALVIFNCKPYSQCYNSSTVGGRVLGVKADSFDYLGGAGTTNVSDYDYMIFNRAGGASSMPFYFS